MVDLADILGPYQPDLQMDCTWASQDGELINGWVVYSWTKCITPTLQYCDFGICFISLIVLFTVHGCFFFPRLGSLVDHFKMALDCFFAVWFVVGNVWIFGGHSSSSEAPNLYRYIFFLLIHSSFATLVSPKPT